MGRHYDYSQIGRLPFVGDNRRREPWNVQWLGDPVAFRVVTGAGMGRYQHRSVAGSDRDCNVGNGQHVVSHSVAAFSVIAIMSGAVGVHGRSAYAPWCVVKGFFAELTFVLATADIPAALTSTNCGLKFSP